MIIVHVHVHIHGLTASQSSKAASRSQFSVSAHLDRPRVFGAAVPLEVASVHEERERQDRAAHGALRAVAQRHAQPARGGQVERKIEKYSYVVHTLCSVLS